MLETLNIDDIVKRAAIRHLKSDAVADVRSHGTVDSQGNDAIRITITLYPDTAKRLDDDAVLDALVAIKSDLAKAGEERPSIVQYEEVGELTEGDDADT